MALLDSRDQTMALGIDWDCGILCRLPIRVFMSYLYVLRCFCGLCSQQLRLQLKVGSKDCLSYSLGMISRLIIRFFANNSRHNHLSYVSKWDLGSPLLLSGPL